MIPKKINELLKLEIAYNEYSKLTNIVNSSDKKKYYEFLEVEIKKLIEEIFIILNIDDDFISLCTHIRNRLKFNLEIENNILDKFTNLTKEQEKIYHDNIQSNTLFKKIMGECTIEEKKYLEEKLETEISINKLSGTTIYDLSELANIFYTKINNLFSSKKIDEREKANLEEKVAYITDYYWSIINGKQEEYEISILKLHIGNI